MADLTQPQHSQHPIYSAEQKAYIECNDVGKDTKLLATAGSGKTFCIIHHICHLVRGGFAEANEIYMLTFSKNAKDDFRAKIRKYGAGDCILPRNVCTIDSFAYRMLGKNVSATIDVSLLSYAWMDELISNTKDYLLEKYSRLKDIRMVFVDEAQDLNAIQYKILVRMKEVCDMSIHMVGDPNQNIYQFRDASDKYLVNYPAHTFYLTRNYRSQSHIVEFCSHLRPYNNVHITAETPKHSALDVTFYAYESTHSFEHLLMSTIHMFQARKIPLHKCAVLAPTRGYIRNPASGACKYKGLCYIANLLFQYNVPFIQFYSDTNPNDPDSFEATKMKYKPVSGQLNLMTYTSSKGLEWDYVIIVDANAHLISRMDYDEAKFLAERYLLYVACSRPRKNLLVFTRSRYANPWFKDVPSDTYKIASRCREGFDFFDTSLLYDRRESQEHQSTKSLALSPSAMINSLGIDELYKFDKALRGRWMMIPIGNPDSSHNNKGDGSKKEICLDIPEAKAAFARFFLTHLYYTCATGNPLMINNPYVIDVYNVINNTDNIIVCGSERVMSWYYENRDSMNWNAYEAIKETLEPRIRNFIDARFDKDKAFGTYTLVDKFYELYIQASVNDIKCIFERYMDNMKRNVKDVLHMSRIAYAIRTTHYFYIKQPVEFEQLFDSDNNKALIQDLEELGKQHNAQNIVEEVKRFVSKTDVGIYFHYDRTWDGRNMNIRTKNMLSIKDMLNGIMIQELENADLPFTEFYTMQLSPPVFYKYTVTITNQERTAISNEIQQIVAKKKEKKA